MKKKNHRNGKSINVIQNFDLSNAGCASECTGLITVPASDDDELENYKDVYDFGQPEFKK